MTDCIHGLDVAVCDLCSPRSAPQPVRSPRARPTASAHPAPTKPGVKVNSAEQRRYLVVVRSRLVEALAGLADDEGWRLELGSASDALRWPDAGGAERVSDLVVLVAAATLPGELRLVAVANEPARRAVRELLDAAAIDARIVLQPSWF